MNDRPWLFVPQLTVRASDQGVPPKTSTATATITVTTDENFPVFDQAEYSESFPVDTAEGTPIATVHATDSDVSIMRSRLNKLLPGKI